MFTYNEKDKGISIPKQYPYLVIAIIELKSKFPEKYTDLNTLLYDVIKTPEWEFSIKHPYDPHNTLSQESLFLFIQDSNRKGMLSMGTMRHILAKHVQTMFKEDHRSGIIYTAFPKLVEFMNSVITTIENPYSNKIQIGNRILNPVNYSSLYELSKYISSEFSTLFKRLEEIDNNVKICGTNTNIETYTTPISEKCDTIIEILKPKPSRGVERVKKPKRKTKKREAWTDIEYCKCIRKTRSNVSRKVFLMCKLCGINFHTKCYKIPTDTVDYICEYCK